MSRKLSQRLKDRANQPGPDGRMPLQSDYFDLSSLPPDCVAVPLSNGGFALVDEEDECRVDDRDWFKTYNAEAKAWYAKTIIKSDHDRHYVYMHRFLFGLDRDDRVKVDHKNHDGLDNRRSTNLRLATTVQNSANVRKLAKFASRYRGVSWKSREKKWYVQITRTCGGIRKRFPVGLFATEAEAAFAFQIAAPLLKDPDFLQFEEIPKDELPDGVRQDEIRRDAIAKVKATLAGLKGKLNATSQYIGVSRHVGTKKWEAIINVTTSRGRRPVRLGLYSVEKEAAYAHDCAVQILGLTGRKINKVDRNEFGDAGRADEIRKEVTLRLEASRTGEKFYKGTASRYRGVDSSKSRTPWKAFVVSNNKNTYLGVYETEIAAAVAYNIAVSILGTTRLLPNAIPEESQPSPEVMEKIRLQVEHRLTIAR